MDTFDAVPLLCDFGCDRRALLLVPRQNLRIGFVPDSIAELAALIGESGDSFLSLFNVSIQVGYRMEPVVLEKPIVGVKLCHIPQLMPQLHSLRFISNQRNRLKMNRIFGIIIIILVEKTMGSDGSH